MFLETKTPFPAARPSALRTIGKTQLSKKGYALAGSEKKLALPVGMSFSKRNFLENILEYEHDIVKEKDILIIAQLMRNILDDFSFEFGYINNEDVYDRVFSNFCLGK